MNGSTHACTVSFSIPTDRKFLDVRSRLGALVVRASGRVEALPAGFRARRQCLIVLQKRSLLGRAHGVAAQDCHSLSSNSTQRHGGVQRVKLHALRPTHT